MSNRVKLDNRRLTPVIGNTRMGQMFKFWDSDTIYMKTQEVFRFVNLSTGEITGDKDTSSNRVTLVFGWVTIKPLLPAGESNTTKEVE